MNTSTTELAPSFRDRDARDDESDYTEHLFRLEYLDDDFEPPYPGWFSESSKGEHLGQVMHGDIVMVNGASLRLIRIFGQPTPTVGERVKVKFRQGQTLSTQGFMCTYRVPVKPELKRDWKYDSETQRQFNLHKHIRESTHVGNEKFHWSVASPKGCSERPDLSKLKKHIHLEAPLKVVVNKGREGIPTGNIDRPEAGLLCRAASDRKPNSGFYFFGERHSVSCDRCLKLFGSLTGRNNTTPSDLQLDLFASATAEDSDEA